MAKGAPKGNQFWKLRAKHGRDKLFKTPTLLWEAATQYFEWCDNNPFIAIEYYGKDATMCEVPKMRPYTLEGLCLYFDASVEFLTNFERGIKEKKDKEAKDFLRVCTHIRQIIRDQKFSGAAAGFFNANIIARDLGLRDKQELDLSSSDGTFAPSIIIQPKK